MSFKASKKSKLLRRALCMLIASLLLCLAFTAGVVADGDGEKHSGVVSSSTIEKHYEIAVAYDNSGSMYNNAAWYQAKYAMEIFASMIDFKNNDKLTVFPMHPVTVDGDKKSQSTTMVTISSVADIDKLHNMYTPSAGGTPFDTVVDAYNYLVTSSTADERWLIVLTDGSFNESGCDTALLEMSKNVKVQFIPFGSDSEEYADNSHNDNFFACNRITSEKQLQSEMINVCNRIFQRDILDGYLNNNTLSLELSMKKVIVFAQGNGAEIISLKDSSGRAVNKLSDSGQRKYSNLGTHDAFELPKELENQTGQVVTFDACAKGKYTLEYSNADEIQVFYEPDVAMIIDFIDEDGMVEDFSDGEIREGEYTYKVKIVDAQTGEDVSTHKLLGGNVDINGKVIYPGLFGGKEIELKNGQKVTFTPGEDIIFDINATYLGKYELKSLDAIDIDWSKIRIIPRDASLKVEATVEQDNSWYQLSKNNDWKPIRLDLTLDGNPLTDEQLDKATVTLELADPNQTLAYKLEVLHGESAINIHIGRDKSGNYIAPAEGDYDATITVSTVDNNAKPVSDKDEVDFKVDESSFGSHLFWIFINTVIAIVILALILGFPTKPKIVYLVIGANTFTFFPKKNSRLTVKYNRAAQKYIFKANCKTHWRWFRNSWLKNVFKWGDMSFKLKVESKAPSVTNLSIENDPVVDGYISWKDGNKTPSANVFTNRKD